MHAFSNATVRWLDGMPVYGYIIMKKKINRKRPKLCTPLIKTSQTWKNHNNDWKLFFASPSFFYFVRTWMYGFARGIFVMKITYGLYVLHKNGKSFQHKHNGKTGISPYACDFFSPFLSRSCFCWRFFLSLFIPLIFVWLQFQHKHENEEVTKWKSVICCVIR